MTDSSNLTYTSSSVGNGHMRTHNCLPWRGWPHPPQAGMQLVLVGWCSTLRTRATIHWWRSLLSPGCIHFPRFPYFCILCFMTLRTRESRQREQFCGLPRGWLAVVHFISSSSSWLFSVKTGHPALREFLCIERELSSYSMWMIPDLSPPCCTCWSSATLPLTPGAEGCLPTGAPPAPTQNYHRRRMPAQLCLVESSQLLPSHQDAPQGFRLAC